MVFFFCFNLTFFFFLETKKKEHNTAALYASQCFVRVFSTSAHFHSLPRSFFLLYGPPRPTHSVRMNISVSFFLFLARNLTEKTFFDHSHTSLHLFTFYLCDEKKILFSFLVSRFHRKPAANKMALMFSHFFPLHFH